MLQALEGTIIVTPHRETRGGQLIACGFQFAALTRDFVTRNGAPVKLGGSFYLRLDPKVGVAYLLKLGLFEGPQLASISAPNNAFVRAPRGDAPKSSVRVESDTPGYALFGGPLDDNVLAAYESIVNSSEMVIGFNRAPGQMDVSMTIDLTVVDAQMNGERVVRQRSKKPVEDFVYCSGDLIKKAAPK